MWRLYSIYHVIGNEYVFITKVMFDCPARAQIFCDFLERVMRGNKYAYTKNKNKKEE